MFPPELYQHALEKEFALAYSKMGSVESWQSIPVGERDWHFHKLISVKEEEKRRMEEEQSRIKAMSKRR